MGVAEVVGAADETDAEDEPGGAAGGAGEHPANTRAATTRTLRTPPGCPITDFTRLSYMVKLTFPAPNREGRGSQQSGDRHMRLIRLL
ncbi:MAG: hypothetical protein ACRDXB_04935, partial [Actinomycetes bacterium]